MTQRGHSEDGKGWREWIVPVIVAVFLFLILSVVREISVIAMLVLCLAIIVGGIVLLRRR